MSDNLNSQSPRNSRRRSGRSQLIISSTGVPYLKILEQEKTEELIEKLRKDVEIDVHKISIEQLCDRYHTDLERGLTQKRADELLILNGPNCLTAQKQKTKFQLLLENVFGGFAIILWIALLLLLIAIIIKAVKSSEDLMDDVYLFSVIFFLLIFTGLFNFYQEAKSKKIMECFKKMMSEHSTVIRNGQSKVIVSEEVVVGDLVNITYGNVVPADIRIIEAFSLKVDNSSLTGENEPQVRSPKLTNENFLETENIAFASTHILEGHGKGIVFATGDDTYMGKIATLTSVVEAEVTPLRKDIKQFTKFMTIFAIIVSSILACVDLAVGTPVMEVFLFFISLLIANVPEGLLVTLTACLTLTAKELANKNCLVKKLDSIETLGSTNVICTDKTGTLTQNKMMVMHVWFSNITMGTDMRIDDFQASSLKDNLDFITLINTAALGTMAEFFPDQDHLPVLERKVKGDASETAILKYITFCIGIDAVRLLRIKHRRVFEIPFTSTTKFALSVHYSKKDETFMAVIKGAPEVVITFCNTIQIIQKEVPLVSQDINYKEIMKKAVYELANNGERVMAFANKKLDATTYPSYFEFQNENFPKDGFKFVGLMSMIDPPRAGVSEAVKKCHSAGIEVIMMTGDHPVTAIAIAKKVGIISPENKTVYDYAAALKKSVTEIRNDVDIYCQASVVTGTELKNMSFNEVTRIFETYNEIVFARITPQQKLQICEALQATGAIVAVTGDGVNDAPAMKRADIGIAMGMTGTEVAKEAANMVLLDDNFSSIINGIEEGRLVFDNLKKSIFFILTSTTPQTTPFIFHILLGIPLPLTVIGIIIIDVVTDLWPGVSLAYEKAESDIMYQKPRDPKTEKLINLNMILLTYIQIGVIQALSGFTNYFLLYAYNGFHPASLFNIRSRWNSETINDLKDDYGREWTYKMRKFLEKQGVTAFYIGILETQMIDVMICRTRRLSLFQKQFGNMPLHIGVIIEILISLALIYSPIHQVIGFEPVDPIFWIPPLVYAIYLFVYEEIRKLLIRKYPKGFFVRNNYY